MRVMRGVSIPGFEGFYNSSFEDYYDSRDIIGGIYADVVYEYVSPIINKITFESIYSPKYYNYTTDEVIAKVEYDEREVVKYLLANKGEFEEFLNKFYSSRSGFTSFIPTKYIDFVDEITDNRYISIVIEFILYTIFGDNYSIILNNRVYEEMGCRPDEKSQTWYDMGFDEEEE